MKKLAIIGTVICVMFGMYFVLRPIERFGTFGDSNRAMNCKIELSEQDAPVLYNASLVAYYITTRPTEGTMQSWGTCPYSDYKAKTYALEFWAAGGVFGLIAYKRLRSAKPGQ